MDLKSYFMNKYSGRAGEEREKKQRAFEKEEAGALARASMAEVERQQVGETRRAGMTQAGSTQRTGMEIEAAKPFQGAEIERSRALAGLRGAETRNVEYDIGFKKRQASTIEDILKSSMEKGRAEATEAGFGISEEQRRIKLRDEAEVEAARPPVVESEIKEPARPGRKMKPGLKRFLWEGQPEIGAPGLLAPVKGYFDIAKLLSEGVGKGYNWAFPRSK